MNYLINNLKTIYKNLIEVIFSKAQEINDEYTNLFNQLITYFNNNNNSINLSLNELITLNEVITPLNKIINQSLMNNPECYSIISEACVTKIMNSLGVIYNNESEINNYRIDFDYEILCKIISDNEHLIKNELEIIKNIILNPIKHINLLKNQKILSELVYDVVGVQVTKKLFNNDTESIIKAFEVQKNNDFDEIIKLIKKSVIESSSIIILNYDMVSLINNQESRIIRKNEYLELLLEGTDINPQIINNNIKRGINYSKRVNSLNNNLERTLNQAINLLGNDFDNGLIKQNINFFINEQKIDFSILYEIKKVYTLLMQKNQSSNQEPQLSEAVIITESPEITDIQVMFDNENDFSIKARQGNNELITQFRIMKQQHNRIMVKKYAGDRIPNMIPLAVDSVLEHKNLPKNQYHVIIN